jgi:hypothetical protein
MSLKWFNPETHDSFWYNLHQVRLKPSPGTIKTFTRYDYSQNMWKPDNLQSLRTIVFKVLAVLLKNRNRSRCTSSFFFFTILVGFKRTWKKSCNNKNTHFYFISSYLTLSCLVDLLCIIKHLLIIFLSQVNLLFLNSFHWSQSYCY